MTDSTSSLTRSVARVFLDTAGLSPNPDEMTALERAYPLVRSMIDALYAVTEARYEMPALHFEPRPLFAPWAPDPDAMSFDD